MSNRDIVYEMIEHPKTSHKVITPRTEPLELKGKYKHEYAGEVTTKKLSPEELAKYLKKFERK